VRLDHKNEIPGRGGFRTRPYLGYKSKTEHIQTNLNKTTNAIENDP
jgi:hypothetical protein